MEGEQGHISFLTRGQEGKNKDKSDGKFYLGQA